MGNGDESKVRLPRQQPRRQQRAASRPASLARLGCFGWLSGPADGASSSPHPTPSSFQLPASSFHACGGRASPAVPLCFHAAARWCRPLLTGLPSGHVVPAASAAAAAAASAVLCGCGSSPAAPGAASAVCRLLDGLAGTRACLNRTTPNGRAGGQWSEVGGGDLISPRLFSAERFAYRSRLAGQCRHPAG